MKESHPVNQSDSLGERKLVFEFTVNEVLGIYAVLDQASIDPPLLAMDRNIADELPVRDFTGACDLYRAFARQAESSQKLVAGVFITAIARQDVGIAKQILSDVYENAEPLVVDETRTYLGIKVNEGRFPEQDAIELDPGLRDSGDLPPRH